ncbi:MAG: PhoH family protein [Candidatus Cryptobacteroides sp.]|nr:PhoH family protein [Rikenellaceae bacterium]MDY5746853.1 PhoH family protein [Candidatus Cryptobacteroides sp.]
MGKAKIFVLDTNVILHDHKAIRKFQDNNLVIPIAVVEELDKFKKGNDALAYNARGFMRDIDRITEGKDFGRDGLPIAQGLGRIKVEPNHPFSEEYAAMFKDDIQDHRILSTAMWVRDHNPGTFVALVTKDVNLRLKAKAAGMAVQDYLTDKVEEAKIENAQREVQILTLDSEKMQQLVYGPGTSLDWKDVCAEKPVPNQCFKLRWKESAKGGVCARYDADEDRVILVKSRQAYGIRPRNDEQAMALDALLNRKIDLVSLTGGAGTGKTLLALAAALEQEHEYEQIILSRPTVVLGNQDLGFLPGDQKQKMGPFLQPLMDNLNVIKSQFRPNSREALRIESMLSQEKLIIEPLAYIRGRSLGKCYFIIDESQNLTPHEMKTIITRAGEGTKMVFTGDIFQIDQPYLDQWSNGLTHLGEKMAGQKLFQHIFLKKGERSRLSEIASKLL